MHKPSCKPILCHFSSLIIANPVLKDSQIFFFTRRFVANLTLSRTLCQPVPAHLLHPGFQSDRSGTKCCPGQTLWILDSSLERHKEGERGKTAKSKDLEKDRLSFKKQIGLNCFSHRFYIHSHKKYTFTVNYFLVAKRDQKMLLVIDSEEDNWGQNANDLQSQ